MSTVSEVLGRYTVTDPAGLEKALLDREDEMVTSLHMAAVQFGLYPQIVAEVVATVGLGTPPSEEERTLIRHNFVTLMQALHQAHAEGTEAPSPQSSNDPEGAGPPVEPEPDVPEDPPDPAGV